MTSLWLAVLTVREAILKGTLIFYFAVGNLIILLFAVAIGTTGEGDSLSLTMFGNQFVPPTIKATGAVDFILLQLYQSSTQAILLFGIFATAGLIPSMLEKGTVELYLSKPLPRASILLSRCLGASGGIGLNLLYFAVAVWLVFGLKVGVWHYGFLMASLLTVLIFFLFYSIVAYAALVSRSTGLAIMFAFIYSGFSGIIRHREQVLYILWDNTIFHRALDALYYGTPQIGTMLDAAGSLIGTMPSPSMAEQTPTEFSFLPFLFSLLSASAIYAVSARFFSRQDY